MRMVLVVEDNADVAEMTCRMVQKLGHRCAWCWSGRDALAWLTQENPAVDLFIIDYRLPDMTGAALALELAARSTAPVLFTTGYVELPPDDAGDVDRSDILSKPYDMAQLDEAIRQLLDAPDPSLG
jgi:CheY-like chemotaxis protein